MPLNYKILKKFGTTEDRLREIFTANTANLPSDASDSLRDQVEADVKVRKELEDLISSRLSAAIELNLKSAHLQAAVDLAWDSSTITKQTIPLVLYAQGRIDQARCLDSLKNLRCADQFIKKTPDGTKTFLDLPRFCEVNINLVRSIITRRVAAQSARFTNLYPFWRYESRGTSEKSKLQGDLMSQRADVMADQYGHRISQVEWMRDMLLYSHSLVVPQSRWHREIEYVFEDDGSAEEFKSQDEVDKKLKAVPRREGFAFTSAHKSRTFYDTAHPIKSINTDTGCEWFGFWDVDRYGSILDDPSYFNRTSIGYNAQYAGWFFEFQNYFNQYFTTINPPVAETMLGGGNDRKATIGTYTSTLRDSSVFKTHLYLKLIPNQWRMGGYPQPVWIHLVVANASTVIAAEIMPDCPGFVFSYNESSQRTTNLSMAAEIMSFQDQLTNLFTQLLETTKRDLFNVCILNLDAFPAEDDASKAALAEIRKAMRDENFFAKTTILEASLMKMKELGVDLDKVFTIVGHPPNRALTEIVQAISQTIMMAERVMALSPQEQAQLSPRETSATEVQVIAGTTENIYQFISDAIDDGRAAIKRYLYNAVMSLGSDQIKLPVVSRYKRSVVDSLELTMAEDDSSTDELPGLTSSRFTVVGTKKALASEYIFTSRDGADRASNIQSAQTLVQLVGILMQPGAAQMITREQFSTVLNTILRQSGAGVDIVIEPPPGTEAQPLLPPELPQAAPAQQQADPGMMAAMSIPRS